MTPKISIITVCYNSEDTIFRTMMSVRQQNYDNLEYIIIDGGSTDGTKSIIKNFINSSKLVVKFISEKDQGIYDAMNKGLRYATGDLICMLNSDDWLEKGALKIVSETYSKKDRYVVYYGMERRVKNNLEEYVGFHGHHFLPEASLPHQACYVTRACYEDLAVYDLSYKSASDYDFFLKLYLLNKVKFVPIYRILVNFTVGGMSSTDIGYIENAKIRKKYKTITYCKYLYLIMRVLILRLIRTFE